MGLFLNAESEDAIHAGMAFLRIVSPWYFMISIKLMTDGIIRGSGAMAYFVAATIPDLILRIGFFAFADTKVWKHRNLDGLALWVVCGDGADDSVLPEGDPADQCN